MATSETIASPPPLAFTSLNQPEQQWLLYVQRLQPLEEVDTTGGAYAETLPPAGLIDNNTGQTNQNMERTYIKISADGNVYTLHGAQGGDLTLTAQYDRFKVKSDGSKWWRTA